MSAEVICLLQFLWNQGGRNIVVNGCVHCFRMHLMHGETDSDAAAQADWCMCCFTSC